MTSELMISTLLLFFVANIIIYTVSEGDTVVQEKSKTIHAVLMILLFITTLIFIWE